jgi:hypothetical protein
VPFKDAWFPENTAFGNCFQAGLGLNFGMCIGVTTLKWSLPADMSVHISQESKSEKLRSMVKNPHLKSAGEEPSESTINTSSGGKWFP